MVDQHKVQSKLDLQSIHEVSEKVKVFEKEVDKELDNDFNEATVIPKDIDDVIVELKKLGSTYAYWQNIKNEIVEYRYRIKELLNSTKNKLFIAYRNNLREKEGGEPTVTAVNKHVSVNQHVEKCQELNNKIERLIDRMDGLLKSLDKKESSFNNYSYLIKVKVDLKK